jgi:hypothetical protein
MSHRFKSAGTNTYGNIGGPLVEIVLTDSDFLYYKSKRGRSKHFLRGLLRVWVSQSWPPPRFPGGDLLKCHPDQKLDLVLVRRNIIEREVGLAPVRIADFRLKSNE